MDKDPSIKELATNVASSPSSTDHIHGEGQHTRYLDKEYIVRAREAEVKNHLHSISQLQKKMEKLASELAWELEQHHSKIHELYQLEAPFRKRQDQELVRRKPNKKASIRAKSRQTLDMPLIQKPLCETVA